MTERGELKPGDRVKYTGDRGYCIPGYLGSLGTVARVNSIGHIDVNWDNGLDGTAHGREYLTKIDAVSVRAQILRKAEEIVSKDRNSSYGEPEDNFARIAAFWNTFLGDKLKDDAEITSGDTAALMILVKLAREMNAPTLDNKIDIAGYVACWGQVDHS